MQLWSALFEGPHTTLGGVCPSTANGLWVSLGDSCVSSPWDNGWHPLSQLHGPGTLGLAHVLGLPSSGCHRAVAPSLAMILAGWVQSIERGQQKAGRAGLPSAGAEVTGPHTGA